MAIKLPPKIAATIKKIPPIGWVIIAGVVLGVLYLKLHKGTGSSVSSGLTGGGGGGGDTFAGTPGVPVIPVTTVVPYLPGTGGTSGGVTGTVIGGGTVPGGTVTPLGGLPGAVGAGVNVVPQSPTGWGQAINLSAPSSDTATLAQQYLYAVLHPGLAGADASGQYRNPLFAQDQSVMRNQAQQLLMSIGGNIATPTNPLYRTNTDSAGNPYPVIPTSVYELAGVVKEQFSPTSFYGGQLAQQGYSLAIDPNIPGANDVPGVQIPYLQAEIAQGVDTATGQKLTTTQIASLRSQLSGLQSSYSGQLQQLSAGIPATYGNTPAASGAGGSPSISTGSLVGGVDAARVATLEAAIATQAKNVSVNTAAGKLTNAAVDQATLDKYKTELAGLQPTKAF